MGKKSYEIMGKKFNRLTAIKKAFSGKNSYWLFKCECGNEKVIMTGNVIHGRTQSCGCLHKEMMKTTTITHGFIAKNKKGGRNPRFYAIWSGMRNRCQNKKNNSFPRYGAMGIGVEDRWNKFENFYIDMYESYLKFTKRHGIKNTSLDRVDNADGYSQNNCRWATYNTQARNRTNNTRFVVRGKNLCISEITEKFNINKSRFYRRLKRGLSIDEIIADSTVYN